MIPTFLGLTIANLLMLSGVFTLGILVRDGEGVLTDWYTYHILFAIAAGLMVVLTHVVTYTYFMATTKWLGAAIDKANLDPARFHTPSMERKRRVFAIIMTAIGVTMATMFAGAAADTVGFPVMAHFIAGITTLVVNLMCAVAEFQCIREQGKLMDDALAIINANPNLIVESA